MIEALIAVIICWGVTLAFLFWQNHSQWARLYQLMQTASVERNDLLDRVMARDYTQFAQVKAVERQLERVQPAITEEDLRNLDLSEVGSWS